MTKLSQRLLLAAETAPKNLIEQFKEAYKQVTSNITGFSDIIDIIVKMVITVLLALIIIQVYRFAWKKWWKKHPTTIQHRFIYNIILILLYVAMVIATVLCIPKSETIVSSIIASSGFLALGLGLAAQEALGNVINGMMISMSKPFEVGDRVRLVNGNITGYVEDITLRHTVIRTFINSRIIVPNSVINKDMIENSNYQQGRASSFVDVMITFDSDMEVAIGIMEEVISNHPSYVDPVEYEEDGKPRVKVFVRDLSINGTALRASMWTKNTDNNFEAVSDARREIKKQFDQKGILLAQIPARPLDAALAGTPINTEYYGEDNKEKEQDVKEEQQ